MNTTNDYGNIYGNMNTTDYNSKDNTEQNVGMLFARKYTWTTAGQCMGTNCGKMLTSTDKDQALCNTCWDKTFGTPPSELQNVIEKWNHTRGLLPRADDKDSMVTLYDGVEEELKHEIAYIIGLYCLEENNTVEAKTWFELAWGLVESWDSQEVLDKYKKACESCDTKPVEKGMIQCQPHFGLGGRWFRCSLHGQNAMECIEDDIDKYEMWQCKICGVKQNIRCRHFAGFYGGEL